MSVYRTDYIIYGWKLPKGCIPHEQLLELEAKYDENPLPNYIEIIIDKITGQFIVFGIVLERGELYKYADTECLWEFTDIDLSLIEKGKDELIIKYHKLFGVTSNGISNVDYEQPKIFIFSHIY